MRGVPRERRATSSAASGRMEMPSVCAERVTICASSAGVYISRRQSTPNRSRSGDASIPARVVAPTSVNFFSGKRRFFAEGPLPTMMSSA